MLSVGWILLYKMERSADSIAAFERAVTIRPKSSQGWLFLGLAQHDQGDFQKAVEALTTQKKLVPEYQVAWDYLGHALEKQGKLTEALEAYKKQIRHAPDHSFVYMFAGNVLRLLGRKDEAVHKLRKQSKSIRTPLPHREVWPTV